MYLVYQHNATASKNKLEDEFFQYLKSLNRKIVEEKNLLKFTEDVLKKYNDLCKEHPRCKPIEKRFSRGFSENNDIHLFGSNTCLTLLKAK